MVDEYVVERHRQEAAIEDGGWRDEQARHRLITFKVWLRHYPWPHLGEQLDELDEQLDVAAA